jgi:glucose-1-phosphate cytidylyltransferase
MKAVILAGGLGTRLSEETSVKPKPMVEIGEKPILWHIMKIYSHFGITDFIICCGYKGYVIKEYFANYFLHNSDVTYDLSKNSFHLHDTKSEPWKVTLVDTGDDTMTGGRLKRVKNYIGDDDRFCFTYGDGLGDVNISRLIEIHKESGKLATLTATRPPGRYGALTFSDGATVKSFREKPVGEGSWINGGFFVLETAALDYIKGDSVSWEEGPLHRLAEDQELNSYKHDGFWQPMDTLREKNLLNTLWNTGKAPWKMWN